MEEILPEEKPAKRAQHARKDIFWRLAREKRSHRVHDCVISSDFYIMVKIKKVSIVIVVEWRFQRKIFGRITPLIFMLRGVAKKIPLVALGSDS
jgi:hypothetical protein